MRTKRLPITGLRGVIRAYAIVDAEDYPRLSQYSWHFSNRLNQLVECKLPGTGNRKERRWLHHEVLGLPPGSRVDHVNGNQLDNRKENLRPTTTALNAQNQGSRGGTSRYRGVVWDKARGKWRAQCVINGKCRNLGRYDTELEAHAAASAYRAVYMPHSEDARLAAEPERLAA